MRLEDPSNGESLGEDQKDQPAVVDERNQEGRNMENLKAVEVIRDVSDFNELQSALKGLTITGSDGISRDGSFWEDEIEIVRKKFHYLLKNSVEKGIEVKDLDLDNFPFNSITRAGGLRDKVEELTKKRHLELM